MYFMWCWNEVVFILLKSNERAYNVWVYKYFRIFVRSWNSLDFIFSVIGSHWWYDRWEFSPQWKSIFKYPFFATQSTPTHHHKMRYNVRILFCDKYGHVRKVYLMRMMLFCIKKRFSLSIPIPGVKAIHTHTKPRARAIRITGRNLLIVFLTAIHQLHFKL